MLSIAFVRRIAKQAQKNNHHPDIDIRFNKVTLKLTTHDEGGITEKDFSLARQCDEVYSRLLVSWPM
jgi:4a-hydroxytetrahydrobiopterin dehydratase